MQTHCYIVSYPLHCEIHGSIVTRAGFVTYKNPYQVKLNDFYLKEINCPSCAHVQCTSDPDWTFTESSQMELDRMTFDGMEIHDLRWPHATASKFEKAAVRGFWWALRIVLGLWLKEPQGPRSLS